MAFVFEGVISSGDPKIIKSLTWQLKPVIWQIPGMKLITVKALRELNMVKRKIETISLSWLFFCFCFNFLNLFYLLIIARNNVFVNGVELACM